MTEIRDDNLRLILSEQEKAYIEEKIREYRFDLWFRLCLGGGGGVILALMFFVMPDMEVGVWTLPAAFLLLVALILVMVMPFAFIASCIKWKRYLGYREDHQAFLRKYGRL